MSGSGETGFEPAQAGGWALLVADLCIIPSP